MTLFGEFRFDLDAFPLTRTLSECPDAVVEIERIVVSEGVFSPYFWVDSPRLDAFEATADTDPSLEELERIDTFDDERLYRARWTDRVEKTVHGFVEPGIVILEASGDGTGWELRIRFDGQEQLTTFQSFCEDHDIQFVLQRLYRESQSMTAGQYGLSDKQREALVAAWNAGYFETPRQTTLEEVAESLDITHQSLSQRLRRAHDGLIANTLVVTPPSDDEPA
ncbi:helix-turn-helix domain-containing protein [Natronolimnohabitans sp. A-GB9]|uniref:helix-turn-helix domain-containing protein n=1 Tax=Natronolimnohabitans sp. A-GB9 TaxID=3069757 RepID=UPI0027B15DC6|nr:helix-turn-helix domain-containing protein [Natronolimnohabitans sp. A-GB9]MDQ2052429.1 helix-turn-helix domain-containing protein [Natronolimnohabitans sp. A-GB9]